MLNGLTLERNGNGKPARTSWQTTHTPVVDILETAEDIQLHVDLPGVKPEDVELKFEQKELTIHARVAPRHQNEKILGECVTAEFHRAFRVAEDIDPDRISATLKNGVLTLRLLKSERVKPRKISVKSTD